MFFLTAVMAVIGYVSYKNTAVETFPDVTNTQIIIIAQWPGRSAEEEVKSLSRSRWKPCSTRYRKKPAYHIILRPVLCTDYF